MQVSDEQMEARSPRWIALIITWLASAEAADVTGRVFDVRGDQLGISEGWALGPVTTQPYEPADLGPVVAELMANARLNTDMSGNPAGGPGRPTHA